MTQTQYASPHPVVHYSVCPFGMLLYRSRFELLPLLSKESPGARPSIFGEAPTPSPISIYRTPPPYAIFGENEDPAPGIHLLRCS